MAYAETVDHVEGDEAQQQDQANDNLLLRLWQKDNTHTALEDADDAYAQHGAFDAAPSTSHVAAADDHGGDDLHQV